jgi:hypothetical protein
MSHEVGEAAGMECRTQMQLRRALQARGDYFKDLSMERLGASSSK